MPDFCRALVRDARSIRVRVQPHPIARLSGRGRTSQRHRVVAKAFPCLLVVLSVALAKRPLADGSSLRQSLQEVGDQAEAASSDAAFRQSPRTPRFRVRKPTPTPTPNAVPLATIADPIDRGTLKSAPKSRRSSRPAPLRARRRPLSPRRRSLWNTSSPDRTPSEDGADAHVARRRS